MVCDFEVIRPHITELDALCFTAFAKRRRRFSNYVSRKMLKRPSSNAIKNSQIEWDSSTGLFTNRKKHQVVKCGILLIGSWLELILHLLEAILQQDQNSLHESTTEGGREKTSCCCFTQRQGSKMIVSVHVDVCSCNLTPNFGNQPAALELPARAYSLVGRVTANCKRAAIVDQVTKTALLSLPPHLPWGTFPWAASWKGRGNPRSNIGYDFISEPQNCIKFRYRSYVIGDVNSTSIYLDSTQSWVQAPLNEVGNHGRFSFAGCWIFSNVWK